MEKMEAVNKLAALGYDARLESSTVMVYCTKAEKITLKQIGAKLTEMGYDASFGIRQKKNAAPEEIPVEKENAGPEEVPDEKENTITFASFVESDGGQIGFDFS